MSKKDLGGSSRSSLAAVRSILDEKLKGLDAKSSELMAHDLFTALAIVDSSLGLRRALTDPSRDSGAKGKLVQDLFGKVISPGALSLISALSSQRWSSSGNFSDALEAIAIGALAASAEGAGELEQVEVEIFSVGRIVTSVSDLRQSLNDRKYSSEAKSSLLRSIFEGKVSGSTIRVLDYISANLRGRNIERTIEFYGVAIASYKERSVAHVKSAVALSAGQESKLASALEQSLGRRVRLSVEVDPTVLGGISIQVGDELIDGTVISRLVNASRSLVGKK
jgi:F-type H+-transporting ATPase subunit delta